MSDGTLHGKIQSSLAGLGYKRDDLATGADGVALYIRICSYEPSIAKPDAASPSGTRRSN